MNLQLKQLMDVALLAGVAFLTAPQASAERISFTLSITAHWGTVILQPGKYTFEVPLASSWPQEFVLTQNGRVLRIFPITEAGGIESNRSQLLLVNVGGSYFVREYISRMTGKVFTFRSQKSHRTRLALKCLISESCQTALVVHDLLNQT